MKRNNDLTRNVPDKEYIRKNGRIVKVRTMNTEPSRTQQQFKKDCDVNEIVAKFKRTGSITHIKNTQEGVYADLTTLPVDLQEARQIVLQAEQSFAAMPAQLRQRFGHDPKNLIEFLENPQNDDEAVKLGLKTRPRPQPPNEVLNTLKEIDKNTKPKKKSDPE